MSSTPYRNYIGVKAVMAQPMNADSARALGYKTNGSFGTDKGYEVMYPDGYKSWSPADVFEQAYRPSEALSFGIAIEAMKKGRKVARVGWNGKGMHLRIVEPYNDMGITDAQAERVSEGTLLPWIGMKTADNKFVPWLASQTDMLAEDWIIVQDHGTNDVQG